MKKRGQSLEMAPRQIHKRTDHGWSWVIAFACCFINCLLYGVARLSGLLLVAVVDTLNVTRASAALPFSVSTSVRNLSGMFVGHLGQRFGVRLIVATGCILSSIGAGLCYFTSDIFWITICWGAIFGTGFGLSTCLLPLAINQHFVRHRGTASGISYSGSYIGSFVFPPIIVLLLENYGLQGTFLIISGSVLNIMAAALLFREPPSNEIRNNLHSNKTELLPDELHCNNKTKDNQCSKFWRKIYQHIKPQNLFLKKRGFEMNSAIPPICLIKALPLNLDTEYKIYASNNYSEETAAITCYKNNSISNLHTSINISDNNNSNTNLLPEWVNVPKIDYENGRFTARSIFSRRNSKHKYKVKLAKLKKLLFSPPLNRKYSFNLHAKSLSVQKENVKLISYSCLHFILCPTIVNLRHYKVLNCSQITLNNNEDYSYKQKSSKTSKTSISEDLLLGNKDEKKELYSKAVNLQKNTEHLDISNHQLVPINRYDTSLQQKLNSNNSESFPENLIYCHKQVIPHGTSKSKALRSLKRHKFSSNRFRNRQHRVLSCKRFKLANTNSALVKETKHCFLGWCRMYAEPMFVVISSTMSLYTFIIVCVITIIEDFAKDIHIPEGQVHYVLMVLSTADLLGTLTLGIITDRGFI
ncbi:Monocarboxylate transporter 9, partial [Stegodyphus mimosarum]